MSTSLTHHELPTPAMPSLRRHERVLDEARALARDIWGSAPIAVRLAKKALYQQDASLLDAAIDAAIPLD